MLPPFHFKYEEGSDERRVLSLETSCNDLRLKRYDRLFNLNESRCSDHILEDSERSSTGVLYIFFYALQVASLFITSCLVL